MATKIVEHPLRALRRELNLTQARVARMSCVSQPTVAKIESGAAMHSAEALRAIGAALDHDWTELCDERQAVIARHWEQAKHSKVAA